MRAVDGCTPTRMQLPLSASQELFCFMEALKPGRGLGSAFTMATGQRITGPVDLAALDESLNELIRRHGGLRAALASSETGEVVHSVVNDARCQLQVRDWSLPPERRDEGALACARDAREMLVDAATPPPLRATLTRLGPEDHVLGLAAHHALVDAWSFEILVDELIRIYDARCDGRTPDLPALPMTYEELAWGAQAGPEDVDADIDYWRSQLSGLKVLDFPPKKTRALGRDPENGHFTIEVPTDTVVRLRRLTTSERATMFMGFAAAFNTLVFAYTGSTDIVLPSQLSRRHDLDFEHLVGFFVDALALRNDLSGDPSFLDVLRRVRATTLDAYEHRAVPIIQLLDCVPELMALAESGQVWLLFQFIELPPVSPRATDATVWRPVDDELLPTMGDGLPLDLELSIAQRGDDVKGVFDYNRSLYADATIEEIARDFVLLLEDIVARPNAPISALAARRHPRVTPA